MKRGFSLSEVIIVRWRDANTRGGWGCKDEYLCHDVANVLTVGFLLRETKDIITVATNQGDFDDINQAIAIPKEWCDEVVRLAVPQKVAKRLWHVEPA